MPARGDRGGFGNVAGACPECARLHLQVDLSVAVGRFQRDVPKPGTDRIDVYASLEQVDCRGMPPIPSSENEEYFLVGGAAGGCREPEEGFRGRGAEQKILFEM